MSPLATPFFDSVGNEKVEVNPSLPLNSPDKIVLKFLISLWLASEMCYHS